MRTAVEKWGRTPLPRRPKRAVQCWDQRYRPFPVTCFAANSLAAFGAARRDGPLRRSVAGSAPSVRRRENPVSRDPLSAENAQRLAVEVLMYLDASEIPALKEEFDKFEACALPLHEVGSGVATNNRVARLTEQLLLCSL